MYVEAVINLAVGILILVLGFLIGKRQKVSLLHDYHYKNVKPEDIPAYARQMGRGLVIIGVGVSATGVLCFFLHRPLCWIPFAAGFAVGLVILHRAQMRYNGSWLS